MKLSLLISAPLRFVFVYTLPLICTFQALQSGQKDQINIAVLRWGILALLEFIDPVASPLLSLLPIGSLFKLAIYIWTCIPFLSLGEIFYLKVYIPFMIQQSPADLLTNEYNSFTNNLFNNYADYVNDIGKT